MLGYLVSLTAPRGGLRVDTALVGSRLCLRPEVVDAALSALLARQLVHQHADGRVVPHAPDGAP